MYMNMALHLMKYTNRSFQGYNTKYLHFRKNNVGVWNSNSSSNRNRNRNRIYCTQSKPNPTGWNSWRSICVRFIPIGVCLIAVMQWRAYRKLMSTRTAQQWEIDLYCSLPLRLFSRCWGWIAEKQLPENVRPLVYGLYASTFGVDISEAESSNLKDYPSLSHFFARGLKNGARKIDTNSLLISPCDGKVLHFGPVKSNNVEQVKGITYSLEQFIGDPYWQENQLNLKVNRLDYRNALLQRPENKPTTLYQCILYLAPGDYHRFHSPANWTPIYRRHFSGELLSVSPTCAKWIPGLFCLNERAVYLGYWEHGFFSFTAVGATNVGSVKVYFDDELETNKMSVKLKKLNNENSICDSATLKDLNISLKKGQPVGEFRMGSTIVLIFEAPPNFEFNLSAGQTVRMGQSIGHFRTVKHVDKIEKNNVSNTTK